MNERFRDAHVLVVSPVAGGSLPISRHVTEALEELGASVVHADLSFLDAPAPFTASARRPEVLEALVEHASSLVLAEAQRRRPDVVLALAQAPLSARALETLRDRDIPTAHWFVENYRVTQYWRTNAALYDWYFTVQRGVFHEKLGSVGARNVSWLPVACNPSRHRPVRLSPRSTARYGSTVCFTGFGYYNRREMLRGLLDLDFKIWGRGFSGTPLSRIVQNDGMGYDELELRRIASAARIHVNLHSASHLAGVDPEGDYLNPRTFELAACGAFQLVDRRSDLPSSFAVGTEIATFEDLASLRERIAYYDRHDEERRSMARAARRRALRDHTYRHRMSALLSRVLGSREPRDDSVVQPQLEGFREIAERRFRRRADFEALHASLAERPHATDDEWLLELAGLQETHS